MQIQLNGEAYRTEESETLETLLGRLQLDQARFAIELNLGIVPRSRYGEIRLKDGDTLEIVRFIGGG